MSWARTITLYCDGDSVGGSCLCFEEGGDTVGSARVNARDEGWTYNHGRDLCEYCSRKQATP